MTIKAIETEYNGYKFRSRLEARWAVFFDAGGIEYVYETEGYEIDGEKYLPDFYLPKLEAHIEVKGKRPGYEKEILRIPKFIQWGGPIKQVVILSDVPGLTENGGLWHFPAFYFSRAGVDAGWWFFYDKSDDELGGHVSTYNYGTPSIFKSNVERGNFSIDPLNDWDEKGITANDFFGHTNHHMNPLFFKSLDAARKARFEYGETPVMAHGR